MSRRGKQRRPQSPQSPKPSSLQAPSPNSQAPKPPSPQSRQAAEFSSAQASERLPPKRPVFQFSNHQVSKRSPPNPPKAPKFLISISQAPNSATPGTAKHAKTALPPNFAFPAFPKATSAPPKPASQNAAGGRPLLVGLPPSTRTFAPFGTKRSAQAPCSWGLGA